MIDLAINAATILLLCAGIGYAFVLSKRVNRLHAALVELGPVLAQFSQAVDRSELSAEALKTASARMERHTERPQPQIETAACPKDDAIAKFYKLIRSNG